MELDIILSETAVTPLMVMPFIRLPPGRSELFRRPIRMKIGVCTSRIEILLMLTFSQMPPSTTSTAMPEITVTGAVTPGILVDHFRKLSSLAARTVMLLMVMLRYPQVEAVPSLIALQLEAATQLETETFSHRERPLRQMASSSQSKMQFVTTTSRDSMSMPSLL